MSAPDSRHGQYFGTEIGEKWWRRFMRDGFFSRGSGEFWIDDQALYFRRYLTRKPLVIYFADVTGIKTGKWHSGKWAGGALLVKLVWKKSGVVLSSGFILSRDNQEVARIVTRLRSLIA